MVLLLRRGGGKVNTQSVSSVGDSALEANTLPAHCASGAQGCCTWPLEVSTPHCGVLLLRHGVTESLPPEPSALLACREVGYSCRGGEPHSVSHP